MISAPQAQQDGSVSVTLQGPLPDRNHVVSLLVLDAQGAPMKLPYSTGTKNERDAAGRVTRVTLSTGQSAIPAGSTVIVLHDLFPLARFTTK